jgi:hypothetical protein
VLNSLTKSECLVYQTGLFDFGSSNSAMSIKGFKCSMNSVHDANSLEHLVRNYSVKNPNCLSGLVITTHTHDDFECLNPRDFVDTKSWLAYERNPYSTH